MHVILLGAKRGIVHDAGRHQTRSGDAAHGAALLLQRDRATPGPHGIQGGRHHSRSAPDRRPAACNTPDSAMVSRLALPVDPAELQEAIQFVGFAVDRYAAVMEDSSADVLRFLSERETVELGAQLIGLSGADGQETPVAVVHALVRVLESGGYNVPPLSGFAPVRS